MRFYILLLVPMFVLLQACSNEPSVKNARIEKAEAHSLENSLFYSGSVEPIKSIVVTSPVDGAVVEMPKRYGEIVKKGDLLFVVSSAKFLNDYKQALMQYIKAKNDFNNSKTVLTEGEFLHKNQLISDDDFKMKKSNYYSNRLVLLQAKDALENLLTQQDVKNVDLYNLSISDIDKITKAMHMKKHSENLRVYAPANGVLLASAKDQNDNKKVVKGNTVKEGDVLAEIGNMQGVSVHIKVNELTINQLHAGLGVKITGIAFPDYVLKGEVTRVDRQGESANNGAPSFDVEVSVKHLTKQQQKLIHAGMSAKVEINLSEEPRVHIPIAAILEKHGASYVKVLDKSTNKFKEVLVRTGKSTPDSVTILSGVKAGDQIVIPN